MRYAVRALGARVASIGTIMIGHAVGLSALAQ